MVQKHRRSITKSSVHVNYDSLSYYMNGAKLDKVTEEKDLGVWISNDLKASQPCIQACSKANRILGVLNTTIKCKDDSNLICFDTTTSGVLYCSLVSSLR